MKPESSEPAAATTSTKHIRWNTSNEIQSISLKGKFVGKEHQLSCYN